MQEEWKDIPGFEGRYQVSNFGRVKSLDREELQRDAHGGYSIFRYKGRILRQTKIGQGYMVVPLGQDHQCCRVHRLVAMAFIEPVRGKDMINHIDGDRTNNHVDNLEWCTNQENQLHASRVLGHKQGRYQNKPVRCVETGEVFENSFRAAKEVRHVAGNIRMAASPKYPRKTCMGYHWEFVD